MVGAGACVGGSLGNTMPQRDEPCVSLAQSPNLTVWPRLGALLPRKHTTSQIFPSWYISYVEYFSVRSSLLVPFEYVCRSIVLDSPIWLLGECVQGRHSKIFRPNDYVCMYVCIILLDTYEICIYRVWYWAHDGHSSSLGICNILVY